MIGIGDGVVVTVVGLRIGSWCYCESGGSMVKGYVTDGSVELCC